MYFLIEEKREGKRSQRVLLRHTMMFRGGGERA